MVNNPSTTKRQAWEYVPCLENSKTSCLDAFGTMKLKKLCGNNGRHLLRFFVCVCFVFAWLWFPFLWKQPPDFP